ncbi:MAG: vWA domain-containing protein, partial [Gemmataceae bacterium]
MPIPGKAEGAGPPPVISGGPGILEWVPALAKRRLTEKPNEGSNKNDTPSHPGRGRVLLINTTVNSDWGRWPASPSFPPLMQELVLHASQARLRGKAYKVGESIELFFNTPATMEGNLALPFSFDHDVNSTDSESPSRKVQTQPFGEGTIFRYSDTELSGVYRLLLGQSVAENIFAVNVPAGIDNQNQSESNPTRTSKEELDNTYPEWEKQVVRELKQVKHAKIETSTSMSAYAPQGSGIARYLLLGLLGLVLIESLLAWKFGHHSSSSIARGTSPQKLHSGPVSLILSVMPIICFIALGIIGFILLHEAFTHDFLGFLPGRFRNRLENYLGVPPPNPGEGSQWRLEYGNIFGLSSSSKWITGLLASLGAGFFLCLLLLEGKRLSSLTFMKLYGLRFGLFLLLLLVLLPQIQLIFERKGWPDLAIILDDSQSMSSSDFYRDSLTKEAADNLAKQVELSPEDKEALVKTLSSQPQITMASRLQLGQSLVAGNGDEWLRQFIEKRQFRLHVYRCASRAQRIADLNSHEDLSEAVASIRNLKATPQNDASLLGSAVRQVLNDFRGVSLTAIIMFTDGVTTEGEDIPDAAGYSAQMGVPLFLVGLGDAQELRDVFIHDLQCEESVYVNDRIIFEFKLTAEGYSNVSIPISLSEKGQDRVLDKKTVSIDPNQKTTKVRLIHQPSEAGIKTYVIRFPGQDGEIDLKNNQIERVIQVQDAKKIRVLYVEGYRRYEYHYLKTLLERESNRIKGNKSIDLRVFLADADPETKNQDQ